MDLTLWHDKRYAPYKLATLVQVMREKGVPPDLGLRGTALSLESLSHPETRTSISQYLTVCRNAIHLSNDPEIPFLVGSRIHLSAYGMYGFALFCSLTVRDFFNSAVKYHGLATPIISTSWREDRDSVSWIFDDHLVAEQSEELRSFLLEQQLTLHVTHIRDVLGQSSPAPSYASAPYPAPKHVALYRKYLGCDCSFNQPVTALAYPRSMLELTPPMANGLSFQILQQTCERILTEAKNSTGIAAKVYEIVASTPGHCPTMEFVADRLATTVRTLHRQLRSEKSSFTKISDDVRCSLAKEYLQTTKLSTEDLAELLGFMDVANFRHAFRRWTGTTPTKFRLQSDTPSVLHPSNAEREILVCLGAGDAG